MFAVFILATTSLDTVCAQTNTAADLYQELYRPQFHFSPARHWTNDPNGLVYYQGEYHLFFQYNPVGSKPDNISWGHAVSPDLMHWRQLPVAISRTDTNFIFSGSAVVDENNTSGFGTKDNPPLVAIYSNDNQNTGREDQRLAYSSDGGRTFTQYADNPVIDINSDNFRDPKVLWYAPAQEWRMVVALSAQHKMSFHASPDLKHWEHLSDFGPAGATEEAWEVPDIFKLAVDGGTHSKWVLLVNVNPGGIAGGSGAQYFIGDFDGTRFVADGSTTYTPPKGTVLQGFEQSDYGAWQMTVTAFGRGPAAAELPDQTAVSGYQGEQWATSFHPGDAATGTLTSPYFTLDSRYLNFLIGGGENPRAADTTANGVSPAGSKDRQNQPRASVLTETSVNLLVDGQVVRTATGSDNEILHWTHWRVADLLGRSARIQIVDHNSEPGGHIDADQFTFSPGPASAGQVRSRRATAAYSRRLVVCGGFRPGRRPGHHGPDIPESLQYGLDLFAEGGIAHVPSLEVRQVRSIWR